MTATFVQNSVSSSTSSGSSLTVTPVALTAGNAVLFAANWQANAIVPTLSSNIGAESPTQVLYSAADGEGFSYIVWLIPSIGAGRTSLTINFGAATAFCDAILYEVSGLASPISDQAVVVSGSATTVNITTGTLTSADEFAFAYAWSNGGFNGPNFSGSGSTWVDEGSISGTGSYRGYLIASSTATLNAVFTEASGTAHTHSGIIVTIKVGSSASLLLMNKNMVSM